MQLRCFSFLIDDNQLTYSKDTEKKNKKCSDIAVVPMAKTVNSVIFCLQFSSLPWFANRIEQVLYVESVSFLMFLSILVAFYDTVSLHQAGQIFIVCIFLSAIIPNVNLAGPQQEQEQAPRQGPLQATEWTSA